MKKIKVFSDKQKLKEFTTTRPVLKEMLKGFFVPKKKKTKVYNTQKKVTNRQIEAKNCNSISEQGVKQ